MTVGLWWLALSGSQVFLSHGVYQCVCLSRVLFLSRPSELPFSRRTSSSIRFHTQKIRFALQGEVTANPGGTVTFRHPHMGRLYFRIRDVRWYEALPLPTIARRRLQKSVKDEDVEACLDAASWALHQGLLPDFYKAASAAWRISPEHPTVQTTGGAEAEDGRANSDFA